MPRLAGDDASAATPLTDEDLHGLIPTYITTRADLNLAEQVNPISVSASAPSLAPGPGGRRGSGRLRSHGIRV